MPPLRRWIRGRFQRDVLWNFGSLAVLGVSGLALNVLIGRFYGAATLGVFNQVMAAYIVFSQAAVGGVDRSVLRATAERADERERVARVFRGALPPTLVLAGFSTLAFWFTRHWVADGLLESPGVAVGIAWATPGLFFFALNKVMLALTNGVRRMRAFAVYNALRFVLILVGLLLAIALGWDGDRLGFVFTFAEGLLFLVLAGEVGLQLTRARTAGLLRWSRDHLRYGIKSALSGMLLELNAKIDVLMVGYFLDDAQVGIYSFAAILAEGVFQLLVVLQNNYNPLLAQHIAARRFDELREMTRKGKRAAWLLMTAACGAAVIGYPLYVMLVGERGEFWASWLPFGLLMAGMWLAAGYMPFAQTMLMANRPGWHSIMMVGIVVSNALLNFLLIPPLGIVGAAAATGLTLLVSALLLVAMVRWRVGLRL